VSLTRERFAGSGKNPAGSGYRLLAPVTYHPSKYNELETIFDAWVETTQARTSCTEYRAVSTIVKTEEPDMNDDFDETSETDLTADEEALLKEVPTLTDVGQARRKFIGQSIAGGLGIFALTLLEHEKVFASLATSPDAMFAQAAGVENPVKVVLKINGATKTLDLDSRTVLLDALRERLELTGSKKGCDHGQCGACTVIVDGRRVLSCLTLVASCDGKEVTTIEGLAQGDNLHPMQAAFIKNDGFQCGYCTPGQICSAVAMLTEAKNGEASYVTADVRQRPGSIGLTDDEIRERMSGNLCRCGAYPNILKAIQEVHSGKQAAQTWSFHRPATELADAVNDVPIKEATSDATV
jgi:xanthine dehydrogenase YagT iron-sulfur-binding subunit